MRRLLPLLALCLSGCVQRALVVESDPPGAEVWIDGEPEGLTPVRVPFAHYGTREIVLSKGGFATVRDRHPFEPPWHERFPLDFLAENLWPGTLRDERYLAYALAPEPLDPDGAYARARVLREAARKPPDGQRTATPGK